MLKHDGSISHFGDIPDTDEELTTTVENVYIVLTWLRLVDKCLPILVKQRYGTDLHSRTLVSLKPEILLAKDSLLDGMHTTSEARVLRSVYKLPSKQVVKKKRRVYNLYVLCASRLVGLSSNMFSVAANYYQKKTSGTCTSNNN